MANRRMFSLSVVDTDSFLEMPLSSRLLYYELGMRADDDGFVDNWKKILSFTGLKDDDLKVLIAKKYILPFDSGVIVIRHWRMNNYLRNDRYKATQYKEELNELTTDDNLVYQMDTNGIHRLGKDRIGKDRLEIGNNAQTNFKKPTLNEIEEYCKERNNNVLPNKFYDFYESKGWMIGKNKMKDWKAAVRTWESKEQKTEPVDDESDIPYWMRKDFKFEEEEEDEGYKDFLKAIHRDSK